MLVLASGSQYRAASLSKLGLPFSQVSPNVDESARPSETPAALAQRLAHDKANSPALSEFLESSQPGKLPTGSIENSARTAQRGAIIVASDQVASIGNHLLRKPGTAEYARQQLATMSNQTVIFLTALHMLNTARNEKFCTLDVTTAHVRSLTDTEIERYVEIDKPMDCAGSFKVEALGISLFDSLESKDPTALIGLPMIGVCRGLRQFGIPVP